MDRTSFEKLIAIDEILTEEERLVRDEVRRFVKERYLPRAGELFATFHTAAAFVNHLTGEGMDPTSHTPEYKRTAVRLRRCLDDH